MSTSANSNRSSIPLVLFLLGTLAFSLSSLPGHNDSMTITVLSSEYVVSTNCDDMTTRMAGSDASDSCSIQLNGASGNVQGTLDVVQVERQTRDSKGDLSTGTTKQWQATLKMTCQDDDCSEVDTPIYGDKGDFAKIVQSAKDQAKAEVPKLVAQMKKSKTDREKEQKKQDQIANCELGSDGQELEDSDLLTCQSKKMKNMTEQQAKNYFEKNIQPEIHDLLASSDPADFQRGVAMLKQLKSSNTGGRYVSESIADLARFGSYEVNNRQMTSTLMSMQMGDPRRAQLLQQMRYSQAQADMYFQNRGISVGNEMWPADFGTDFMNSMTQDLASYRYQIDQSYAAILQQHQNMIMDPRFNPQVQAQMSNDPRLARLPVAAPQIPWGGVPSTAAPIANPGVAPAAATSGATIPKFGSPVTSLPPAAAVRR